MNIRFPQEEEDEIFTPDKNLASAEFAEDQDHLRKVIIIDNQTQELKPLFKYLIFSNLPTFYTRNVAYALEKLRKYPHSIILAQTLLFNSDIPQLGEMLKKQKFKGRLIPVCTDPLEVRALDSLKTKGRVFVTDLSDMEKVAEMIKRYYEDRVEWPLELSPFVTCEYNYHLKIPSDLSYVDRTIHFLLKQIYNLHHTHQYDSPIRITLIEALSNAIEHGNKNDICKYVEVKFHLNREQLRICVRDEGEGFDHQKAGDLKSANEKLSDRGRGIFMIRKFMDEVKFNEKGNEIHLLKKFDRVV